MQKIANMAHFLVAVHGSSHVNEQQNIFCALTELTISSSLHSRYCLAYSSLLEDTVRPSQWARVGLFSGRDSRGKHRGTLYTEENLIEASS